MSKSPKNPFVAKDQFWIYDDLDVGADNKAFAEVHHQAWRAAEQEHDGQPYDVETIRTKVREALKGYGRGTWCVSFDREGKAHVWRHSEYGASGCEG